MIMSAASKPTNCKRGKKRPLRPCPSRRLTLADRLPIDSVVDYARKVHAGNGGKIELGEAIVISICAHFQSEGSVSEAEVMAAYKLVIKAMFPEQREGEQHLLTQQPSYGFANFSPQSPQPCSSGQTQEQPLRQDPFDNNMNQQQPTKPQSHPPSPTLKADMMSTPD